MLPPNAIEALFARMLGVYGRDFTAHWEGQDIGTVKSNWSYVLDGFGDHLAAIGWALENLPERAPNAIEFRNLCRRAPAPAIARLERPAASQDVMHTELAKMHALVADLRKKPGTTGKNLEWAKRLLERHESGAYRSTPAAIKMARDALEGK